MIQKNSFILTFTVCFFLSVQQAHAWWHLPVVGIWHAIVGGGTHGATAGAIAKGGAVVAKGATAGKAAAAAKTAAGTSAAAHAGHHAATHAANHAAGHTANLSGQTTASLNQTTTAQGIGSAKAIDFAKDTAANLAIDKAVSGAYDYIKNDSVPETVQATVQPNMNSQVEQHSSNAQYQSSNVEQSYQISSLPNEVVYRNPKPSLNEVLEDMRHKEQIKAEKIVRHYEELGFKFYSKSMTVEDIKQHLTSNSVYVPRACYDQDKGNYVITNAPLCYGGVHPLFLEDYSTDRLQNMIF